jgi:hypothetical protein
VLGGLRAFGTTRSCTPGSLRLRMSRRRVRTRWLSAPSAPSIRARSSSSAPTSSADVMARRAPRPSTRPQGSPRATAFPVISVFDTAKAQYVLCMLYASLELFMGAMQSLAAGFMHLKRVGKIASISGTARSSPPNIAVRFAQRSGACVVVFPDLFDHSHDAGTKPTQPKNRFHGRSGLERRSLL